MICSSYSDTIDPTTGKAGRRQFVYWGNSGEDKPTGVGGGSIFIETDHSDGPVAFVYDEASESWKQRG